MSSKVPFTKMSGAGNDFVVLDGRSWDGIAGDRADWVRAVCRRGLAVGADGVLVVARAGPGRVAVRFMNPDAGDAFCGNGSRCAARFAATRGMVDGPDMILETAIGDVSATLLGASVRLTLPPPVDRGEIVLTSASGTFRGRHIVAGVPHVVFALPGLADARVDRIGPALRHHAALGAEGANVNLVERETDDRVRVRTFERGVEAETLACGSGAVAVALDARLSGAPASVTVVPWSGIPLTVEIPGDPARPERAILSGDARIVYTATLDPEALAFSR